MDPIISLALSKIDIDKAIKATIAPDQYSGEAVIKITYDLRVGEGYEQAVAASIPWQRIAGVLFSKLNGVTVESVVREALAVDPKDAAQEEIAQRAKEATASLLAASKRAVSGKVTGDVDVEVLS